MSTTTEKTDAVEDIDTFRNRARASIRARLREVGPMRFTLRGERTEDEEARGVAHDREIQRELFDAGLAGLCVPREYGGQGLTPAHQEVLNEELAGYEYPMKLQIPTFSPILGVLLEFGSEEQKRRHIPAMLKGEAAWVQFLSEPSGGSDMAGALTSAVRDGGDWMLNGSKIWTTNAAWSDWALCLARTNWDVPKHRGLTVFMLPVRQPGIEVHRIETLGGNSEFCQEYLSDVRVPDSARIGEVDGGWGVCTRWVFHERMLFNSPLVTHPVGTIFGTSTSTATWEIARDAGRLDDPVARDLVGEAQMLGHANQQLQKRLREGIVSGAIPDSSAAIGRLFGGVSSARMISIAFELAGPAGAAWTDDDGALAGCGTDFLMRQSGSIGGGTTEMARNVVAERVLGMPREQALDREGAFRDVPRGRRNR
jgi:alkylation response protein AidB-like acyl-CoA dehydrogenase